MSVVPRETSLQPPEVLPGTIFLPSRDSVGLFGNQLHVLKIVVGVLGQSLQLH